MRHDGISRKEMECLESIDHWPVKNKFNGNAYNLESKTERQEQVDFFVTSNVGGCIMMSVNSNLSPRGGKGRDRIVDC